MSKIVTIKEAYQQTSLIIAKSFLEDQGISCFIKGEFAQMYQGINASNRVELQVLEEDAERAIQLLTEGGFDE